MKTINLFSLLLICIISATVHLPLSAMEKEVEEERMHVGAADHVSRHYSAALFKATRGDLSFYMLGTQHDRSFTSLSLVVQNFLEECIKKANSLAVESIWPPWSASDLLATLKEMDAFFESESQEIDEVFVVLLKGLKSQIAEQFKTQECNLEQLNLLRPWATLMLASYLSLEDQCESGMDAYINRKFLIQRVSTHLPENRFGLETRDDVIGEFSNGTFKVMSPQELVRQANFFIQHARLDFGTRMTYEECVDNFLIACEKFDDGEINPLLKNVTEARNRNWAVRLLSLIDQGNIMSDTLVVVGLDHFLGKVGLVELLTENGFSVEQLSDDRLAKMKDPPQEQGLAIEQTDYKSLLTNIDLNQQIIQKKRDLLRDLRAAFAAGNMAEVIRLKQALTSLQELGALALLQRFTDEKL